MATAQPPLVRPRAALAPLEEPPRKRRRTALSIVLGVLLLLTISAAATVIIVDNEVGGLVHAFKQTGNAIVIAPKELAPTYKGGPQTLLLVGTDQRKHQEVFPHSNEMLLVRINPGKPTISMLSIPRELSSTFTTPDGEHLTEQRFNSAYFYGWAQTKDSVGGGIKLMLETIKNELGLSVNHVFVIDFKKFEHAIQEMGCVYFPVDKRYYHSNHLPNGEPSPEQYKEIHLEPGYQTLCGQEALEYVANRHESTSLMRDARDQRFVLEVKKQYGGRLFEEREKFERILGKDLQTTPMSSEEIVNLLYLLVESTGKSVRQVHFPLSGTGFSHTGSAIDFATPQDIHGAVTSFLGGTRAISGKRIDNALHVAKSKKPHAQAPLEVQMTPTSEEALQYARRFSPALPFPLEYPRIRNSTAAAEADALRLYKLHAPNHVGYKSYVIVIDRGYLGQYYDVEGTTWTNPPIIANPSREVTIGKRTYMLFYSGEHIVTVAWREYGAVYWIENTLTNNVSPRQMLEIAEETRPLEAVSVKRAPVKRAKEAITALSNSSASAAGSKRRSEDIAIGLGAVSLLLLLSLAALVVRRRRQLQLLREEIAHAVALEARRSPLRS
ncbi:MAG: LCP family protein [Solirubrobacteraceae bacterium]